MHVRDFVHLLLHFLYIMYYTFYLLQILYICILATTRKAAYCWLVSFPNIGNNRWTQLFFSHSATNACTSTILCTLSTTLTTLSTTYSTAPSLLMTLNELDAVTTLHSLPAGFKLLTTYKFSCLLTCPKVLKLAAYISLHCWLKYTVIRGNSIY